MILFVLYICCEGRESDPSNFVRKMRLLFLVLIFLLSSTTVNAKIHNILHCKVKNDVILECDGTTTPITEEHERAMQEYMNKLAAYYRALYPIDPTVKPPKYLEPPVYPQLCKICK
ncbi:hypothetical protein M3Y98_00193200 [Aphelenchoides besseyi]|nr:hypothetical protein M3Y98_00193200 [Aphelenchoides besseyi]KAI6200232.1 hypothetical protein M3Y96_00711100 [Aphelenchoides besseyi]